ncbi:protein cordon-bleu isoform X1 [Myotis daubentonii]|uniref:protein cordon-bleu isoform X1 n=2 Tax=Myotis daubentonii TaxID=98922 RepID=UPI0028731067|nr:protein cordon-bleu isoform X1 [Myotis daubentonii]
MDAPCASAAKPPTGRKMKARAPPPPGKAATPTGQRAPSPQRSASPGRQQNLLHMKENLRERALDLTVVLPSGLERRSVVSGSHAMMDLLVELCLQNHLSPSHHALEAWSPQAQQPLSFKPNTPVGTLNVCTVFLKEKVPDEEAKPGPPSVPEKSVRLVVNYLRTQKAVVRVSPEVPLHSLLPVICAKCDVSPEHVVLLRDNVAGEELELSKSLSELGIKELYAWDNQRVLLTKTQSEPSLRCRETFRKSSSGSDETEKEKKKFLGFFKVNKRSNGKVEPGRLSADSDEDTVKLAPGRASHGSLTTPNSPSVNSRSITLGPSLSLSSISGVSVKSDMKKRRAPPPPSLPGAGPPAPDKASEKMSLGSQMDLQRKKRRAPAPPPPSPLVPLRTEDREENRKSAMGGGRQVPQKPPRGTPRGPPQLVLPPPPPYPPPDTDVAEPLGSPGEGAAPEAADPRPTLSLPLGPGGSCEDGVPAVPAEAEETVSVSSCFASEDTTEDSGVMSSPSDIVSLDSQHDSTKSRDKWATDQEDSSDQDLAGTPELGLPKSPAWERSGLGHWHSRAERAAAAPGEDGGLLIAGQWEQTLAGLDQDLEGMDDSYETDSSSVTGSLSSASGRRLQGAIPDGDTDAIPVTFIGEVLDDPVEPELFPNRNNNAGSFDRGSVASRWARPPPAQVEAPPPGRRGPEGPGAPATPQDVGKEVQGASSAPREDVNPVNTEPPRHDRSAKEPGQGRGAGPSGRTPATEPADGRPGTAREADDRKGVSAPPSWYQRGQNPGGSFGLKYGLTTYKIVPPKSERRCYDPGVSLSTGAIKIDELGNLVSPPGTRGRSVAPASSALEKETQPLGQVREFPRAGSTEQLSGRPPATPATSQHPAGGLGAEPGPPGPAGPSPQQPAAHQGEGRCPEPGAHPPPPAATGHTKAPAASTSLFLKPQRRTSSQYVASAIAKRMGPPRAQAAAGRPGGAGKPWEGAAPELRGRPRAGRDATAPSPRPGPHACPEEAAAPGGRLPPAHGEEPAGPAVGALPRGRGRSPPGRPSAQNGAADAHAGPSVPLATAARRDREPVGPGHGSGAKQSPSDHSTGSAWDPSGSPDSPRSPPPRLVNGSRWAPEHGEPPASLRASGRDSHAAPELEGRPGVLCTEIREADESPPPSIFGPKKKFRPVVQRPAPKDTSLHSALMEAIHSAGGRDRLRKTPEPSAEGGPKKLSYVELESGHSALLAAIRGHRGACSLRKVASCASEELQSFREAARSAHGPEPSGLGDPGSQPPPALPPPPPPAAPAPPPASRTAPRASASASALGTPVDARQALMDAIRSGTGAARLRKVPLLV